MKIQNNFTLETTITPTHTYCKICRGENDIISFKDQSICEECVEYIKGHC